jgi:hypothetical protein
MIVNSIGPKHPRCPVVENYITEGQEKRNPILIQDNHGQHYKEMEMQLNIATAEMHEFGRGRDQAETGYGRTYLSIPLLPACSGGYYDQNGAFDEAVGQTGPDQQAKADHANGMKPEQHQNTPVPRLPGLVRERASLGYYPFDMLDEPFKSSRSLIRDRVN